MRWDAQEILKRALPYGVWRWEDVDGRIVETIFNRRLKAIATRVDGRNVPDIILSPTRWPPEAHEFFYGEDSNTYPDANTEASARGPVVRRLRAILRDWGIDPDERMRAIREEVLAPKRLKLEEARRHREWMRVKIEELRVKRMLGDGR
jgi:hypothetical protein